MAVEIADSAQGFVDSAIVEMVALQASRCQELTTEDVLDTVNSRAEITLGQGNDDTDCVSFMDGRSQVLLYRREKCMATPPDEREPVRPTAFQPKCIVVLLTTSPIARTRRPL